MANSGASSGDALRGIIGLLSPVGGAGRSTLALGLGATLAQEGLDVLVIDLDPGGGLSCLAGLDDHERQHGVLEAIGSNRGPFGCILETGYPGLSLMPSDLLSVSHQVQFEAALADWRALSKSLEPLRDWYHTILLDPPAGTERAARAVINASDEILVPLLPDPLAVRKLPSLLRAIVEAREGGTSKAELAGVFLNRVDPSLPFFSHTVDDLFEIFRSVVLETAIPADPWFVEAAARAMPLPFLLPEAAGSVALSRLIEELQGRLSPA